MGVFSGPDTSETGLVLSLDASNKKSYSQNEFLYPTDIFANLGGSANNATLSRDTISSPVGNTPMKMVTLGSDPYTNASSFIPAAVGQTWVVSVYVKANVSTTGQIFIFNANTSGAAFVNGSWVGISATTFNITTEWTRVSWYLTSTDATTGYVFCRLDGPDTYVAGTTIWWDGLQIERVPSGTTTPTPFTSSYYGGSVFRDLVGSNNGTLTNYPTYNSSNGGSLVFDGTDDNIQLGNTSNIVSASQSQITVNAWVKTNVVGVYKKILTNVTAGTASITGIYFSIGPSPYNTYFGVTTSGGQNAAIYTQDISTTSYTNLCGTYDGSNIRLYLNGTLVATQALTGTLGTGGITRISGYDSNAETWNGNIAQVSIYNRALTSAEIQQNFNATRSRFGI